MRGQMRRTGTLPKHIALIELSDFMVLEPVPFVVDTRAVKDVIRPSS